MRVANIDGRAHLLFGSAATDINKASDGRFPSAAGALFDQWEELREWAPHAERFAEPYDDARLKIPAPTTRQVFAIGTNYRDHADEAAIPLPSSPMIFTKFPASLAGPRETIALPSAGVDYEVELVVVIGRKAVAVTENDAWSYVAGLCVGQDLSERSIQHAGPVPQFSMGKSFTGFGPFGPAIVTTDEVSDPDDLELGCAIGEEILQQGRTKDMVFAVPELIARISAVLPLLPGDLLFTGTPAGVGLSHTPPRFLKPGETLTSWAQDLGTLINPLTSPQAVAAS